MAQILIISDTPNLRISLAGILQRAGYNVQAASPGEMPQLLNTKRFDLLLFELRTPYESGLKLLASVRSLYKVTIIVLSSATYPRVRQRALLHGATHFLLKPVDPEMIIQYVRQTIERKKSEPQTKPQSQRSGYAKEPFTLSFLRNHEAERRHLQIGTDFIDIVMKYLR